MSQPPEPAEAEIARRLATARHPGSPNQITVAQLREWAIRYLWDHDQEVARFPHTAGEPHWNLWMVDVQSEGALFAALVFRPDGLEFFCGTGDAFAIRRFAESDFPDDIDQLPVEMAQRFVVPEEILPLDSGDGEAWLGRGW